MSSGPEVGIPDAVVLSHACRQSLGGGSAAWEAASTASAAADSANGPMGAAEQRGRHAVLQ